MRRISSNDSRVSSYDRYNATLVSLIVVAVFPVSMMALIYFASLPQQTTVRDMATPIQPPATDEPADSSDFIVQPGEDEFPSGQQEELLTLVRFTTEAVSSLSGNPAFGRAVLCDGGQEGERETPGTDEKTGDGLEYRRWVINYEEEDLATYAEQLDHFGIILGVVRLSDNEIVLIEDVTDTATSRLSTRRDMASWLRFEHRKPVMRRWDKRLVERAGVSLEDSAIVQFYPDELRIRMNDIESTYLTAEGITVDQVHRTYFNIKTDEAGIRIVISDVVLKQ